MDKLFLDLMKEFDEGRRSFKLMEEVGEFEPTIWEAFQTYDTNEKDFLNAYLNYKTIKWTRNLVYATWILAFMTWILGFIAFISILLR